MLIMLSETTRLCKRLAGWVKTNNKELYLAAIIILVAVISFGLGRLSKIREEKTPITIENVKNTITPGANRPRPTKSKIASGLPPKPKPKKPATNRRPTAKG